ncbi:universal stress protein [Halomarina rubra]|uniref:Universal stress protein n=1 Tax=Halomarina rubra TaxID=2071873 RepID=A0ABD6AZN1_9EURY|nr:universal stress protein [Halomarina rubra]
MYDRILLALDDSDCAATARDVALDLAERDGATLHAVSVVEVYHLSTVEERTARERATDERLATLADRAAEAGVDCETERRAGFAEEELLGALAETDADLVVMGTHGRSGVQQFILGSVAARVSRRSSVPVLTTPADGEWAVETVVLPDDGSEHAAVATDHALALATTYGARLHVLSVVDDGSLGYDVRSTLVVEELEREATATVDATVEEAEAAGVEATGSVAEDRPHRAILDAVDAHDADLVVMGTHGRSGVSRIVLGSVAEKVVRASPVPVLTVPLEDRP